MTDNRKMTRRSSRRHFVLWVILGLLLSIWNYSDQPFLASAGNAYEHRQQMLIPRVYLPLVMRSIGPPPAPKVWSGVHLGNRIGDWNSAFLQRIDPSLGGQWPSAVVVLSNQVYHIQRYSYPCRIRFAGIRAPVIFDYIRRAAQAGVRVIIRIYPSPGNFIDWDDPNWGNHHLSPGIPVGPDAWCRPDLYRSKADLAEEMGAIHELNEIYGFSEFGFEPANEPNTEWYTFNSNPPLQQTTAWAEMDEYFSWVYDWAHNYHPGVRVLTPPMAQSGFAENIDIRDCSARTLMDENWTITEYSGYDMMSDTYGMKNDGVNWHNYWVLGKERYALCPEGQHISIYFPWWMKTAINTNQSPVTISEADLASPGQGMGNPLPDKSGSNAALAADSIRHFFDSEWQFGGAYHYGVPPVTSSWLLTDDTGTPEHDWHKAYSNDGTEQDWFRLWYWDDEPWP